MSHRYPCLASSRSRHDGSWAMVDKFITNIHACFGSQSFVQLLSYNCHRRICSRRIQLISNDFDWRRRNHLCARFSEKKKNKTLYRIGGLAHFVPSQQADNKCPIGQKYRTQCSENTRTIKSKFSNWIAFAIVTLWGFVSPEFVLWNLKRQMHSVITRQ